MDQHLHLSNAIISTTVQELLENELIRSDEINGKIKEGFVITDRGLAYLEDKKVILLIKEIRNPKRLLRPRLSKKKISSKSYK